MTSLKTHHENGDDNEAYRKQIQIVWKMPLLKIDETIRIRKFSTHGNHGVVATKLGEVCLKTFIITLSLDAKHIRKITHPINGWIIVGVIKKGMM